MARARILVADDHKGIRETVVHLLSREFDVIETVNDGRALIEAVDRLHPDLCIIDISMPIISGIEAAAKIKKEGNPPKLIFLTIHDDQDFVAEAFNAGADAYVIKGRMAADLIIAVKAVLDGRTFVSAMDSAKPRPSNSL